MREVAISEEGHRGGRSKAIAAWARRYYRELASFVDALTEPRLRRAVEVPVTALVVERYGSASPATLAETML